VTDNRKLSCRNVTTVCLIKMIVAKVVGATSSKGGNYLTAIDKYHTAYTRLTATLRIYYEQNLYFNIVRECPMRGLCPILHCDLRKMHPHYYY